MPNSADSSFEQTFQVKGLTLAAKAWHKGAKTGAIAVHGWLDNANSFDLLAPLLQDFHIVALDSAGHGKSDFRSKDAEYLIWSEIDEIMLVADQLGWESFVLIGHSRGAAIASLAAGTFPERISRLILVEGGVPLPITAVETPDNLAQSVIANQRLSGTSGTLFPSYEAAVEARADGFTKVDSKTAEILAARSLLHESGGYRWHADARLKAPSTFKLVDAQINAFLSRISAPSLLILGHNGIAGEMSFARTHIDQIPQLTKIELPGGHHLHMEGAEMCIADEIRAFCE